MLSGASSGKGSRSDRFLGVVAKPGSRKTMALRDQPLFAGLESAPALLLAVSGGPDSMALLHLAAEWADHLDAAAPALYVATVDHGLRPEARDEALFVSDAAKALDLPHAILPWIGPKPSTRVQERARAARYSLLADHARHVGATHILTAHHADDQAETILLRLGRGSGIGGLAGMRRDSQLTPDIVLTRPLLALPKTDLVAFCREEAQTFVEDPSNLDPAYARVRLRQQSAALDALGLDRPSLLRLARRMARADEALERETSRVEVMLAPERGAGLYAIRLPSGTETPGEILLRVIRRAIDHVVPGDRFIRLDRLEGLTEAVHDALRTGASHRATLGGARIVLGRDRLLVVRPEPSRRRGRNLPIVEVDPARARPH